jgi:hypothetical protein
LDKSAYCTPDPAVVLLTCRDVTGVHTGHGETRIVHDLRVGRGRRDCFGVHDGRQRIVEVFLRDPHRAAVFLRVQEHGVVGLGVFAVGAALGDTVDVRAAGAGC